MVMEREGQDHVGSGRKPKGEIADKGDKTERPNDRDH